MVIEIVWVSKDVWPRGEDAYVSVTAMANEVGENVASVLRNYNFGTNRS